MILNKGALARLLEKNPSTLFLPCAMLLRDLFLLFWYPSEGAHLVFSLDPKMDNTKAARRHQFEDVFRNQVRGQNQQRRALR